MRDPLVTVGGTGGEVTLTIHSIDHTIVRRYVGADGVKALDGLIGKLITERNWLASEVESDERRRR